MGAKMISQDSHTASGAAPSPEEFTRFLQRAREEMMELDAALKAVGSQREPARRTDRAPLPHATSPIYDPAALSY